MSVKRSEAYPPYAPVRGVFRSRFAGTSDAVPLGDALSPPHRLPPPRPPSGAAGWRLQLYTISVENGAENAVKNPATGENKG
jgi:hypothetical protein